ncbi:hypothetical protein FB45DRAFT_548196 [Roridomyces roridus]|uniref:Uncharacterized protein n=1 Tax=Roridomyces roridus TaxID=1738132 RepID=A0AAD7BUJ8_9AGAR|nr:hypothetical protein FB45DRAFT_548196 [Roridomyces roridus]
MNVDLQQHNTVAANWDPEILAEYMKEAEDSDEAMSSGESDDEDDEFDASFASMAHDGDLDLDIPHPEDITSDDSAFSSDDEFAEESITDKQRTRHELVMGRPSPAMLTMRPVDLKEMHIGYMKQLNDADAELSEMTGEQRPVIERRPVVSGYDAPIELGDNLEAYVTELRKRSDKEIVGVDRKVSIQQLVVLAQSLFRKERQIKHLQE